MRKRELDHREFPDGAGNFCSIAGLPDALALPPLVMGGWALLLPVAPLEMARSGASTAAAAIVTAVFMATTVLAQLPTPFFLRAAGYRPLIAVGALLMGAPCAALLVSSAPWWWYAMSAVRGIGFGILTVSCTSLPARIAPSGLLGRTATAQGVAMSLTQAVGLGTGLFLDAEFGFRVVVWVAVALPVLGCLLLARVPSTGEAAQARSPLPITRRRHLQRLAVVGLVGVASAAFGGLSVLLPIESIHSDTSAIVALTLLSIGVTSGRFAAGRAALGGVVGRLDVHVSVLAGLAMFVLAAAHRLTAASTVVYVSAAVFGICWGVVQNDTIVALYRLCAEQGHAAASKWWNVGIDVGVGIGSFVYGVVASTSNASAAYALAALALVVSAPLAVMLIAAMRE